MCTSFLNCICHGITNYGGIGDCIIDSVIHVAWHGACTCVNRCQDYVQIIRGEFGSTEVCGTTINSDAVLELEFGDFMVIFRSSEDTRGEGFELYTICFRPEEADLAGLLVIVHASTTYVYM